MTTKGSYSLGEAYDAAKDGVLGQVAPNTPSAMSPTAGFNVLNLTPTLLSSGFSASFNNDTHTSSQWQVAETQDFATLAYDSGISSDLTHHTVPANNLVISKQYFWRVRHKGAARGWSGWSAYNYFVIHAPSAPVGECIYDVPGTESFIVPANVTSICVLCVGAGGTGRPSPYASGGGGGGLAYKNNIPVTPGQSIVVTVGAPGSRAAALDTQNTGGTSSFGGYVSATGGTSDGGQNLGGSGVGGDGNATGGRGNNGTELNNDRGGGGGGAAGYTGNGGQANGGPISGGGGTGGNNGFSGGESGGGGGGVGLFGEGASGAVPAGGGTGGNGGSGGGDSSNSFGGTYGGGGGGQGGQGTSAATGGVGAVRVIWGEGRSFPNNAGVATPWGEAVFTTTGVNTFTVPYGVTSISGVAIGGGGKGSAAYGQGKGGSGGGLHYRNNITVTPGQQITVFVGAAGTSSPGSGNVDDINWTDGQATYIGVSESNFLIGATGGASNGGTPGVPGLGASFGIGGVGGSSIGGGGGAGGYTGNGGAGGAGGSSDLGTPGSDGASGQGGGGSGGQGGQAQTAGNTGGSSASQGQGASLYGLNAGENLYGFGGGAACKNTTSNRAGGDGGARIIWGVNRSFPNNAV
jgi:hypothetical protein